MKKMRPTKNNKREVRKAAYLIRPPRLEGKVKNLGIKPEKKLKRAGERTVQSHKPQGYSASQRKDYQLKSKRNK